MPPLPPDATAAGILDDLLTLARRAGADAADALLVDSAAMSMSQRLGKPEEVQRAESGDLGLRVFVGKRQAIVSSTDRSPALLKELAERAVAMARLVPEDEFCGLADPDSLARDWPDLDLCDPSEPVAEDLLAQIAELEETALAVPGVSNSEGADAGWSRSTVTLAASNGFSGGYSVSRRSLSVSVLAGSGMGMERDYDYHSAIYAGDLESPVIIGRRAGERVVARLNPRKVATQAVPVVFDPRVAGGLVSHLTGAISGAAIARGTSFLKDKMGQAVFAPGITIVEDPHIRRGLRSKPFDAEGQANTRRNLIDGGVLTTWLMDCRSARQLGLASTGHAARGTGGPPGPSATNVYLAPGEETPEQLLADIRQGFYVTSLMGSGVNGITGDYSRGASGFWIEDGKIAFPVAEVTIAGNLKDMYLTLRPANDLEFRHGVDSPTLRVEGMTVAGT
ncbi:microcin-processing peptidase 1 [Nitrospirillum amazonense]|uniref:Microcin-processing peptidase 1 n=1 Tax=Nitrospirillum amazonense TaxID=28077 RepID=A0A560FIC7_9PROT|nr:metallopeptidase TldD-related protein [Nitrospirillum amazonense]TWB21362.1 microcin-processing peptidase 1 [Nitrospirillum amazonense]